MQNIANSVQLKERNMARVLATIRTRGPISRISIAKELDLSPPTVSSVVDELLASQLVEEVGVGLSGGGRKPVLLALKPSSAYALGADLSDQSVKMAVVNLAGQVVESRERELRGEAWPELFQVLASFIEELGSKYKLVGMGVVAPGIISPDGMLHFASREGWRNLPLLEDCQAIFPGPVAVENNVRAMALGEYWFGVGQEAHNLVMVRIGGGIGSGIVFDGQIFRGDLGAAGEIGHVTVEPDGPPCQCGNRGCLEKVAALPALANKWGGGEEEFLAALEAGEARAEAVVREAGEVLGLALANLINLFSPRLIVLSSPKGLIVDKLLPVLRQVIDARAISWQRGRVTVVASAHREKSPVVGAASLILARLLSQPRSFLVEKDHFQEGIGR
ncbi:MAG TPA: ROK family transcriptional regulator [Bacillota bacterium]|nr:ROK family transcriptional regulator [Bacillota bacterium]